METEVPVSHHEGNNSTSVASQTENHFTGPCDACRDYWKPTEEDGRKIAQGLYELMYSAITHSLLTVLLLIGIVWLIANLIRGILWHVIVLPRWRRKQKELDERLKREEAARRKREARSKKQQK